MKIRAQQHFVRFAVQGLKVHNLLLERRFLNERGEEILDLIEIFHLKQIEFLRRFAENPGDCLIIEQEVDPVHTLSQ